MGEADPIQGELQAQIMAVLWRIEYGTVDQVRSGLPAPARGAYNTVQTVLNRLAERGLLTRERRGKAIVYRPRLTEAEYLSNSIERTLAGASSNARQAALAQLIGGLKRGELKDLQQLAEQISTSRRKKRG